MTIEHGCKNRQDSESLKEYLKALANEIVMPKHKMKRMKEKIIYFNIQIVEIEDLLKFRSRIKYSKRRNKMIYLVLLKNHCSNII